MIVSERRSFLSVAARCSIVALFLTVCFVFTAHGNAQTNWPMPGHDAQHTGRANFAGPTSAPAAPAWTFSTASPIVGDIVTSAEGNLYFASDQLYALKPDGTAFVPSVSIGVPATGPIVDDGSGLIYIAVSAADGGFDLLRLTKQLQGATVVLHVPRPANGTIISPLVLGRGGLVFFIAGRFPGVLYAAGPVQWSNPVCPAEAGPNTPFGAAANSPVVSPDGSTLFVMCGGGTGGQDGLLRVQAGTGAMSTPTPTNRNSTEPALDSLQHIRSGWQAFGGAIFCGDFLAWDFSLSLLTTPATACDSSRFTTSRAAIMPDGQSTVRIGFAFPPNNQLDAEGINNWIISTDGTTMPNFTSFPSVDAAGNVFIGNTQGIEALSSIDGRLLWSFTTGDSITTQPVIANGGALYVGSSSGKVYAFNTTAARQSGTVYVSGSGAGFATVDLLSASVTATNNTFTDGGVMAVSADGTRSYVSAIFGLAVVDNTTNQVITTISVGSRPEWVTLSPDGSRVYVSQPNNGSAPGVLQGVYVIDAATNAIIASIPIPGPQRLAVAPDNSRAYVGSGGRGIAVIDPATNNVIRSIDILGAQTTGIAFTPDGAHAYVGEFNAPSVYLIDARVDALLQTIPLTGSLGGGVSGVIASPDGSKVYAGNVRNGPFVTAPRDVFVIDTVTNAVTGQIPVSFPSPQFAISNDGANLLLGDSDIGNVIVASLASNSVVESIHVNDPCCPNITGIGAAPPAAAVQPPTPIAIVPPNLGPPSPTNPQGVSAEPVSTGNGNYFYHHTDFAIPGRGIGLRFERTYNSLDSYSGPLGANWTHNYNVTLTHNQTTAQIKWGDGHGETFTLVNGTYMAQPGVFSRLTADTSGTFGLTTKSHVKYLFGSNGKLLSITDRNGNAITLTYGNGDHLIRVSDAVGRFFNIANDASGRIIQITDPLDRSVVFTYDAAGNLASAVNAVGNATQYAYDASHRVLSITLPNGSSLLQNTYDPQGRVASQKNGRGFVWSFAYNTPGVGQTTIVDARSHNTLHIYDSSGRLSVVADALGGITQFGYDSNNNVITITDPNGHIRNRTYDPQGNLVSISDGLGNTYSLTYDAFNDPLTITTPLGNQTTFAYDIRGNLTAVIDPLGATTRFAYDDSGQLVSKTDANSNLTVFAYDGSGNLLKSTDPLGHSITMSYDGDGRLLSLADANTHVSSFSLDALDRIVISMDPLGNSIQRTFDSLGNLTQLTDANKNSTTYGYDEDRNLKTVTDALNHLTQYTYDGNENRISFVNAKGSTTNFAYDALNRLQTETDPLNNKTTYTYDAADNVTAITDANSAATQFAYDAANRLTRIAYPDGTNVAYTYDADGRRIRMTDHTGTTFYFYDTLGRLLNVTTPSGETVGYGYDRLGNRASLKYPDGTTVTSSYDVASRLLAVKDSLGRSTVYGYDPANNLKSIQYPNGAGIGLIYDIANRLTAVANTAVKGAVPSFSYVLDSVGNRTAINSEGKVTTFSYDPLNQLISAVRGSDVTTWSYDLIGNRIRQASGNEVTDYLYDAADRLTQAVITSVPSSGTAAETDVVLFGYDANGSRIFKSTGDRVIKYSYDAAKRLVGASGGGINSTFGYDGDGNRVLQSTSSGTYSYTNDVALGLPVVLNEAGPDGIINYTYGLNLIEEQSPYFNNFYGFDGVGSVAGLTDVSGGVVTTYKYDAWGNSQESGSAGLRNKFRFTGEGLDPETGLYFLRSRYLDTAFGNFTTQDRFKGFPQKPATTNHYSYVANNPLRFRDPSGMLFQSLNGLFGLLDAAGTRNQNFNQCVQNFDECDVDATQRKDQQIVVQATKDGLNVGQGSIGLIYNPTTTGLASLDTDVGKKAFEFLTLPQTLKDLRADIRAVFTIPNAQAPTPPIDSLTIRGTGSFQNSK
jgi:RHS repeat-associated protein